MITRVRHLRAKRDVLTFNIGQVARMPFTTGRRIEASVIVVVSAISFPAELWKDRI